MKHPLRELQPHELHDFKKLVFKIMLFAAPFLCIFLLNVIVDPFNLNRLIALPLQKKEIACSFNERLWKLNNLNPEQKYIILGDSRAVRLSVETLKNITGKNFANLAFSGATLLEIIDTFWFIVSRFTPHEVTFCSNFDRFNDWQKAQGVHEAITCIKNPIASYFQPQTCKATFSLLTDYFFSKNNRSQAPPMTRDDFWNYQIDEIDHGYQRYVFPVYAARQLTAIADYCKQHAIALSFIIFPTHTDLQKRIDHAHLREQEVTFTHFLTSLAPTHNFDVASEFTHNKKNFDDPKHICYGATDYIIERVWKGDIRT